MVVASTQTLNMAVTTPIDHEKDCDQTNDGHEDEDKHEQEHEYEHHRHKHEHENVKNILSFAPPGHVTHQLGSGHKGSLN